MPVTKSRNGMHDFSTLDQTNTTGFLFGDDEEQSSDFKTILQMTATDDNFPVLYSQKFPHKVSSSNCF